ncbi:MAG: hypothetical protein ACRDBG_20490 [Waterburya sp.]
MKFVISANYPMPAEAYAAMGNYFDHQDEIAREIKEEWQQEWQNIERGKLRN